jgi:hypothetical protein
LVLTTQPIKEVDISGDNQINNSNGEQKMDDTSFLSDGQVIRLKND